MTIQIRAADPADTATILRFVRELADYERASDKVVATEALLADALFGDQPAAYALIAANEAEKASNVKLVDCRFMGAAGRLYLAGAESDVRTAAEVAIETLQNLAGGRG